MNEAHIPQIAQLETICFSEPWSENALRDTLDDPKAVFFAAVEGDTVLGYAGMHDIIGEGYVDNIAVFPEHRGKGIGEALTGALIDYSRGAALDFLTLEVRAGNTPAVSLYRKLGMLEEGRRKNFYRHPTEDALIMTIRFEH
jgi:ribosomal-protein-alanine N-acetyltransferase